MKAIVDLQLAIENINHPDSESCEKIMLEVLTTVGISDTLECTIRIVDEKESTALNEQYRNKQGATNVLSFPFESPAEIDLNLLGDLVICAPIVIAEAQQQKKSAEQHWTHLIVHGCLHLLGYDHSDEAEADEMEKLECQILMKLGHPDPYRMIDAL